MSKLQKTLASKLRNDQGASKSLRTTDLTGQTQAIGRSTTKLSAVTDLKRLSNGIAPTLKGIQFGSPSHASVNSRSSTSASNEWTGLLKTASGGAASLIGGGFLESGIGSLISDLTSLFGGGGKSEAPLVRFTLPDPQQQTMYMSSTGLSTTSNSGGTPQNMALQGTVYRQSDLVQAVKTALLTSSSLNDVIAEI
jgi:hypothetical protein